MLRGQAKRVTWQLSHFALGLVFLDKGVTNGTTRIGQHTDRTTSTFAN